MVSASGAPGPVGKPSDCQPQGLFLPGPEPSCGPAAAVPACFLACSMVLLCCAARGPMPAAGIAAACMEASDTSARGLVRARGGRVVLLLWLLLLCLLMLVSPADSGVRLPDVALYTSVRRTAARLLFTSCLLCPIEGLPRMSMEVWPIMGRAREPRDAADPTLATLDALDCRLLPAPEELLGRSGRTMPAASAPACCCCCCCCWRIAAAADAWGSAGMTPDDCGLSAGLGGCKLRWLRCCSSCCSCWPDLQSR